MRKLTPLKRDCYYHIYNRGTNRTDIFIDPGNYDYFLEKWAMYVFPVAETFAYCLLRNHFHALIRIRLEEVMIRNKKGAEWIADPSRQFSHMFNGYAQGMNKIYKRTGSLFEHPFKRNEVTSEEYLRLLVAYIHLNPVKHDFTNDYRNYPHSSYKKLLSDNSTFLSRETVLKWFDNKQGFIDFHINYDQQKMMHTAP